MRITHTVRLLFSYRRPASVILVVLLLGGSPIVSSIGAATVDGNDQRHVADQPADSNPVSKTPIQAQEYREAATEGAEAGADLARQEGANVTEAQIEAARHGAIAAVNQTLDRAAGNITVDQVQQAARGAAHGVLLQSDAATANQIQSVVDGSTRGALSQPRGSATGMRAAAYGAGHGAIARHARASEQQVQSAALGAAAGAVNGEVQYQVSVPEKLKQAAQGGAYGALERPDVAHDETLTSAARGAAFGALKHHAQANVKQIQFAAIGGASGALVGSGDAPASKVEAGSRGGAACGASVEQTQRVSVEQIQVAAGAAATGGVSQSQNASAVQIQSASEGACAGVLQNITQLQIVDITQIQIIVRESAAVTTASAARQGEQRPITIYIDARETGRDRINAPNDDDRDGLTNAQERELGTDPQRADTDGDGLSDGAEVLTYGTDLTTADTDGDGLNDGREIALGTDPTVSDTDGDGVDDGAEVDQGSDPFDPNDPDERDRDDDGLTDEREEALGTDTADPDTDGDGLSDGAEVDAYETDPLVPDTDDDGLGDSEEPDWGTDPTGSDTDDDGVPDGEEVQQGTDPTDPHEFPTGADSDGDGLSDAYEEDRLGTDPDNPDSDGDGLTDSRELDVNTDPTAQDTDGDGYADGEELQEGWDPLDPDYPDAGGGDNDTPNATLEVADQIGDGVNLTVENAASEEDFYLSVSSDEITWNRTKTFNASETFSGNLTLDPPLVILTSKPPQGVIQSIPVSVHNADTDDEVATEAINYTIEAGLNATVSFSNQTSNGSTVTVDSSYLSVGGFVAIHDASGLDGSNVSNVVGVSRHLVRGTHDNLTIELDEPIAENQTLIAIPHWDTNRNSAFDFVATNGSEDIAYTANGNPVSDEAVVSVAQSPDEPDTEGIVTDVVNGTLEVRNPDDIDYRYVLEYRNESRDLRVSANSSDTIPHLIPGEYTVRAETTDGASVPVNGNQSFNFTVAEQGPEGAPIINSGTQIQEYDSDGVVDDWYAIEADAGDTIKIIHSSGDSAEVTLHYADGTQLAAAESLLDDTATGSTVNESGTYYVNLRSPSPGISLKYSATVRVVGPDQFEPNEDAESAAPIEPGERVTGIIADREEDWFAVEADAGQRINATLTREDVEAIMGNDLGVAIVSPNGSEIGEYPWIHCPRGEPTSRTSITNSCAQDTAVQTAVAPVNGTYYVHVSGFEYEDFYYNYSIQGFSNYSLRVNTSNQQIDGNLTVDDQTGDGSVLTVAHAGANTEYYIELRYNGEVVGTEPFDADELITNRTIDLAPPIEDNTTVTVSLRAVSDSTELVSEEIDYSLEDRTLSREELRTRINQLEPSSIDTVETSASSRTIQIDGNNGEATIEIYENGSAIYSEDGTRWPIEGTFSPESEPVQTARTVQENMSGEVEDRAAANPAIQSVEETGDGTYEIQLEVTPDNAQGEEITAQNQSLSVGLLQIVIQKLPVVLCAVNNVPDSGTFSDYIEAYILCEFQNMLDEIVLQTETQETETETTNQTSPTGTSTETLTETTPEMATTTEATTTTTTTETTTTATETTTTTTAEPTTTTAAPTTTTTAAPTTTTTTPTTTTTTASDASAQTNDTATQLLDSVIGASSAGGAPPLVVLAGGLGLVLAWRRRS